MLDLHPLWSLKEVPALYLDAYVADDAGQAVFMSFWGRDTAIQELLAKLTLFANEGGLSGLTLAGDDGQRLTLADRSNYEKRAMRGYRDTRLVT